MTDGVRTVWLMMRLFRTKIDPRITARTKANRKMNSPKAVTTAMSRFWIHSRMVRKMRGGRRRGVTGGRTANGIGGSGIGASSGGAVSAIDRHQPAATPASRA